MQKRLPHLVLLACLGAPSGSLAQEQSPPPDPTVEYRDRIETKKHEEINREREYAHEMELLKRKSSDCETDRSCAETDDAIQRSLVPGTAIMAVLHDIDVDDNALRVRIRFYNAGEELAVLAVDPSAAYEAFYVEAGGEKSFILRDEDGRLRAKKSLAEKIEPGGMESWWAEFPPLPEDVASFDVAIPPARFEEVFVSSE